jgi:hypothetical protein
MTEEPSQGYGGLSPEEHWRTVSTEISRDNQNLNHDLLHAKLRIVELREERDRLRDALQGLMDWVEIDKLPMDRDAMVIARAALGEG